MVFDPDNLHRRKSSIPSEEAVRMVEQRAATRKSTACIVHQLIETQSKWRSRHSSSTAEDHNLDKPSGDHQDDTNSRLLTKRELADMTWGVRQLSKKLASIQTKPKVKTVFVLTKAHDESLIAHTRAVTEWLLSKDRDTPYVVCEYSSFLSDILKLS